MEIKPSKIVCAGLNYKDHAEELKMKLPKEPVIFLKPTSSIIYNEESIKIPKASERVDYEAELAIVIGKTCKSVKKEDAKNYIKGFTILNDVTARDLQEKDGQWTRAKSFDTFCPVGPKIVSGIDANNLKIQLRVNGKIKQDSNTNNMIFSVEELVEFVSSIMTLYPDDIISTGTPPGIGKLEKGDIVEIEIENIGILKNFVE
ncbi:2-keto-4-pentenoate hydratase/2-oxohepta-3-ene-1,7-dioic acid hydratase in catechol pathway [Methanococcus maripaludis]|uniref:2-keto-4-pentenoate hydratase/2-oxohepta-3-ene-1,7-dioic acid hydratase in catechol pathway n=1 Tax=Methanococcus maripaludis TaxID=39152 RepID=A0A7J9P8I3_METMI|nr:fumarylacetoacetate hydrolase family protein [Methanococcus maripaludis]MBA2859057.1 2-keto-4-pentenoate hydratase/2-oxohepta-3-ene-1,7-dioic acid hydratase in catechol pathway [Methanococcus maripaludis]